MSTELAVLREEYKRQVLVPLTGCTQGGVQATGFQVLVQKVGVLYLGTSTELAVLREEYKRQVLVPLNGCTQGGVQATGTSTKGW